MEGEKAFPPNSAHYTPNLCFPPPLVYVWLTLQFPGQ